MLYLISEKQATKCQPKTWQILQNLTIMCKDIYMSDEYLRCEETIVNTLSCLLKKKDLNISNNIMNDN
jgi:hypothetical protein